jgi:tol-pal system protein YbgF
MRRGLPFLLLAALTLEGCIATQKDVLELSQQTDNLTLQVQNLKKIMGSIQTNQADLNEKLDLLHKDVSSLNENLKDSRDSMSGLSAKMDDLGSALGSKVASLDRSLADRLQQDAVERKRIEQKQQNLEQEVQAVQTAPKPSELFHQARIQMSQGQYDLAAQGFQVYLEKYPKGEMVDLATYHLGDALYAQEKWEEAARSYAVVLDRYRKSDVTPAARLRYAMCLIKLQAHLDEAKRYLESIPQDFPQTPEAKKSAEILKGWKAKKPTADKK